MSNGRGFDIVVYGDSGLTGQLVADGADLGGALNELVVRSWDLRKTGERFRSPVFSY
jgi:short subunit dehydrogenase-like uncharacterized protein|tara:strand:- start:15 stop:185 length:171 start_codon:yes stop_codon:yes gene_type:complete